MTTQDSVRATRAETIMVADDDKNIIFAFRKVLEKSGYRVISTQDGRGVLDQVRESRPGALFWTFPCPRWTGSPCWSS